MKSFVIDLPDQVAAEVQNLVTTGWFISQDELVRLAILEFLKNHHLQLMEKFQLEDIDWALQQLRADS